MHLAVKASALQKEEWLQKQFPSSVSYEWVTESVPEADVYVDLMYEDEGYAFSAVTEKPVLVNAVVNTATMLPLNCIRINGWGGFLKNEKMEICGNTSMKTVADHIMNQLQWKYHWVADEPGMIAPRVVAMIINEAYFGLQDGISSKAEIDVAMRLGTNYPFGPFEWAEKIGLKKIVKLLEALAATDARYSPCDLLVKEAEA
ncbi:MAG: hypothetical protein KGO81_09875 [Bacteroidota bacterium]|nr:hypothetical protein [Bacteroidota bacterium]